MQIARLPADNMSYCCRPRRSSLRYLDHQVGIGDLLSVGTVLCCVPGWSFCLKHTAMVFVLTSTPSEAKGDQSTSTGVGAISADTRAHICRTHKRASCVRLFGPWFGLFLQVPHLQGVEL